MRLRPYHFAALVIVLLLPAPATRAQDDDDNSNRDRRPKPEDRWKVETLQQVFTAIGAKPPDYDKADKLLEEAVAKDSADPYWPRMQAHVARLRGDLPKAITHIKRSRELAPQDPSLIQTHVEILLDAKSWPDAIKEASSTLESHPKLASEPWPHAYRAIAAKNTGDAKSAEEDFAKAAELVIKKEPEQASPLLGMMEHFGQIDQAIAWASKPADKDPRWKAILANLHLRKGDAHKAGQIINQAMNQLDDLDDRARWSVLAVAGQVYIHANQHDLAAVCFEGLVDMKPDDVTSLNNLSYMLSECVSKPDPARALELSQHAIKIAEEQGGPGAPLLDTHGWNLVLNKKVDEGIIYLKQAMEQLPDDPDPAIHLAKAHLRKSPPDQKTAADYLEKAKKFYKAKLDAKEQLDPKLKSRLESAETEFQKAQAPQ
jgi:tetratricopeptide (TPR) repeat protein